MPGFSHKKQKRRTSVRLFRDPAGIRTLSSISIKCKNFGTLLRNVFFIFLLFKEYFSSFFRYFFLKNYSFRLKSIDSLPVVVPTHDQIVHRPAVDSAFFEMVRELTFLVGERFPISGGQRKCFSKDKKEPEGSFLFGQSR